MDILRNIAASRTSHLHVETVYGAKMTLGADLHDMANGWTLKLDLTPSMLLKLKSGMFPGVKWEDVLNAYDGAARRYHQFAPDVHIPYPMDDDPTTMFTDIHPSYEGRLLRWVSNVFAKGRGTLEHALMVKQWAPEVPLSEAAKELGVATSDELWHLYRRDVVVRWGEGNNLKPVFGFGLTLTGVGSDISACRGADKPSGVVPWSKIFFSRDNLEYMKECMNR